MNTELDNQAISNLKNKIDALLKKGFELSKSLSSTEKYAVMKQVVFESMTKAISNITKEGDCQFTEQELKDKKEQLEDFVQQYFDKTFSEYIAREWEETLKP